jgi:hypothetical protein
MRGLDPELKSARAANYLVALRAELLALARACGARHPALIDPERIEIVSQRYGSAPRSEVFGYEPDWRLVSTERRAEIEALIGAPMPRPSRARTPASTQASRRRRPVARAHGQRAAWRLTSAGRRP